MKALLCGHWSRLAAAATLAAAPGIPAAAQLQTQYQDLVANTPGLQNYWPFEDLGAIGSFTTVADIAGGKDGAAIGTVESVPGLIGFAGSFPGDSDSGSVNNFIEITGSDNDTSMDLSGGSFTVEALVRTDTLPADNWSGIVTKGDSAWRIARSSGNDFIQAAANGLGGGVTNAFHDLDNGIWHYVALRYDAATNTQTAVFDDASVTTSVDPAATINTNDFLVMIGANAERPEREWLGLIDEVAIYTSALSDSQIGDRVNLLDTDPGAIDQAAVAYWTGGQPTGSFAADAGWDNTAPQTGDFVVIGKGGEVTFGGGSVEVSDLEVGTTTDVIGNDSSGDGTLVVTGGELFITGGGDGTIGKGATGRVVQSGGSIFFAGEDYELGEDPNGDRTHTMTGGLLQIGYWVEAPGFTGGFFMTNDDSAGDDLSIGRDRSGVPGETAKGVLDMSGDAEVRVANDVFLDVGIGELYMADTAVMRVGDDFRAASADLGEGLIDMSGQSNLKVEGRFSIADSTGTTMDVTLSDQALVEVGMYMTVGGQDNLNESGDGTLTIEDGARINIGAFLFRGDVGGAPGVTGDDIPDADRVADEQILYVGAGSEGAGSGRVFQTGDQSLVSAGRQANIGHTARGEYYLAAGTLEVRGDAPISGVDFPAGLDDDDGFSDRGGDLIIGFETTGDGLLSVEGGDLAVQRDLTVGLNGTGRLRVEGDGSAINVGGDFGIGGDFAGPGAQDGTLEIVLTGDALSVIHVNGGTEGIPGDVYLYDADLDIAIGSLYDEFRPGTGDSFTLIDYAGELLGDGAFASITGSGVDGIQWAVENDTTLGQVRLVAELVAVPGDVNFDGTVDATDEGIVQGNLGQAGVWADGDVNNDGVVDNADLAIVRGDTGLVGDLNGDGFVGAGDLDLLLGVWNQSLVGAPADLNADGFIGAGDLDLLLGNWNAGTAPSGSAAVIPEPASLAALALGGVLTLTRRRA